MHETFFQLPAGYDATEILKLSEEYGHPAKELNVMEGSIEPIERHQSPACTPGLGIWAGGGGCPTHAKM